MPYVLVLLEDSRFPSPVPSLVPPALAGAVRLGCRVAVPVGRRLISGFVVGTVDRPCGPAPAIRSVLVSEPLFDAEQLALAAWVADRYLCTLLEALRCVVPAEALGRTRVRLRLRMEPLASSLVDGHALRALGLLREGADEAAVRRALGERAEEILRSLRRAGWIEEHPEGLRIRPLRERVLRLAVPAERAWEEVERLRRRAPRRAALLERLLREGEVSRRDAEAKQVRALLASGLVEEVHHEIFRDPLRGTYREEAVPPVLTPEQHQAVEAITEALRSGRPEIFLLYGVTGSGKTEVYLRATEEAVRLGRTVLVLVPEISLTPQTVARFAGRFGERVAVLHSQLAAGERLDTWRRIRQGEFSVVVGPRSVVFAPLPTLGLVVVDEEHEGAYKQDHPPRYHAREVALERARRAGAPAVLGSATPSVESFFRARSGAYRLLVLPRRVADRPLPEVRVVDMRRETSVLSGTLVEAMRRHLEAGSQVVLYLNRRGYAAFLLCRECGEVPRCRRCDVSLTYHLHTRTLRCHYCGRVLRAPSRCPRCGGVRMRPFGPGTQRVEEEVRVHFGGISVARADRDTMRRRGAYDRLMRDLRTGHVQVLVGTQMIGKGLDLPRVGLVGVVAADVGLGLPDFRAAERTFQQLAQVAGRAGRGEQAGEVVVQTYHPDHPVIRAAQTHDYLGFYEAEVEARRTHRYPPFSTLVKVVFAARTASRAEQAARDFASLLPGDVEVLGPSPAPLARLRGWYRWQVVVRSEEEVRAREAVRGALEAQGALRGVWRGVDVDPLEML
ncbi:MAG: primosomal protein N' [Armatimonadetes bacterium]|nr:primosomal protein N' [Armatimonadota bacterium]MDW8153103.1 primosomal protein N' [Armatimonadota bacterium]